jgi:hypothetical protein
MAKPIITNNGLDPLKDLVNTGISIIVHEKNGDVTSPLFIKNDGTRWYLNSKLFLTELCDKFDVAPPAEEDTTGKSCATPMNTKDCDRQELLDVLDNIYGAVDGLELTTENINLNANQINLSTDEVEQLLKDILKKLTDDLGYDLEIGSIIEYCRNDSGDKTKALSRQYIIFDSKNNAKISEITEWSVDGSTWSTTAPSGMFTIGDCTYCKENKTYQIKGTQSIEFEANKIYSYKVGVWNISNPMTPMTGKVRLLEGIGNIDEYGFGDSFGNGDDTVLLPTSIFIEGLDADADIRISVMQDCEYVPIIV